MVIVVEAHKLAYMALPKAGCSSVKEALARVDPAVTVPKDSALTVHTWHEIYPTRRFRIHRWETYTDYWRFCVVRDPARRLISCYTDLVVKRRWLFNSRKLRRQTALPADPDPDLFFANLKQYAALSSVVKHHVLGAWLFLGKDLSAYDTVYKTEQLDRLGHDLGLRTGTRVTMPRRNQSGARLALEDLQPATLDAIRPFLTQEYDFLSDYYENPLGPPSDRACTTPVRRVS